MRSLSFILALAVATLMTAIQPALVGYVVLGIVIAFAIALFQRFRADRAALLGDVAIALAGLAATITISLVLSGCGGDAAEEEALVELPATLTAKAEYDKRAEAWDVTDTFDVYEAAFQQASDSKLLPPKVRSVLTVDNLALGVERELAADGWQVKRGSLRLRAVKDRPPQPVEVAGMLPAWRNNELSVPTLSFRGTIEHKPIPAQDPDEPSTGGASPDAKPPKDRETVIAFKIFAAERSTFQLTAPPRMIGATDPASQSSRDSVLVGLSERVETVAFNVRSEPFRNDVLAQFADVTIWSPFKWILVALLTVTSQDLAVLLPRPFKRPEGAKAPGEPRKPASGRTRARGRQPRRR